MKYLFVLFFVSLTAIGAESDALKKLKWSYEVYKENEKEIRCDKSTGMGTLNMGPFFPAAEKVPTHVKELDCHALAPVYNAKTDLVDRKFVCTPNGKPKKILGTATVTCGKKGMTHSEMLAFKTKPRGLKIRVFCYL